jgi:type II secretory pathway predicted ATPase ExeA
MDLAFWGFRHWPFERSASGNRPFVGASHDEALARLLFLVEERRRCGLLSGAAGTGKSCLLRQLQAGATRLGRLCVRVDATGLDGRELAWRVADGCQADCNADDSSTRVWSSLQTRFAGLAIVRQPVVALIDHFDLVEFGCNQSLRRLMQLADATGVELTVLIAARERFTAPLLLDSVELYVELSAWSEDETARFLWDSLRQAGSCEAIFTADAIQAIQALTHGNPSKVVWLCDLALLAALSEDRRRVDSQVVEAAAMELSPRSLLPSDRRNATPAFA